jgi:Putative prokaryotic signal transducing protein
MELKTVTTANDIGLATILVGVLEGAGIRAVLSGGSERVYPGTALDAVRILVRPEDLDRAMEVLAAAEDDGIPGVDDEDE